MRTAATATGVGTSRTTVSVIVRTISTTSDSRFRYSQNFTPPNIKADVTNIEYMYINFFIFSNIYKKTKAATPHIGITASVNQNIFRYFFCKKSINIFVEQPIVRRLFFITGKGIGSM